MANTYVDYTVGASQTDFAFSFPYLDDTHVVVQLDDSTGSSPGGKFYTVSTGDYSIITSPSALIRFTTAPETGARIRIKRDSASDTALVDFENGSVLTEVELDRAYLHNLYLNEEIEEGSGKNTMTKDPVDGNFDADLAKIKNVADPTAAQDAATKNYVDTRGLQDFDGANTTSDVNLNNNKLTNVTDPSSNQDAATKNYVDGEVTTERTARIAAVNAEETARIAADALKVDKAGDSMTGVLSMSTNKITNLGTPTDNADAVTKAYADTLTLGGATEAYVNQQISNQITGSSTAPSKYTFTGNGSTAFTFSPGISLSDDTMYEVAIDGVIQEPTSAYAINSTSNTINFTSAPPSSSNIVVVQRGYSVPVSAGLTLSSIENIANNTLLGNDNGSAAAPQALTATEVRAVINVENGATADQTASEILTSLKTVDGTGSGLDADLLDGQEATAFAAASHTHTASNISDFDTEVANNSAVTANTAKVTNATHIGDATGDTSLTLATVNSNIGSFTNADITVNAKGLITAASSGSSGSGSLTAPTGTTVATSGTSTLPGGLIIKFGQGTSTTDTQETFTFPTAFPNNHFSTVLNRTDANASLMLSPDSISTSGFTINRDDNISGSKAFNFISMGN